MESEAPFADLLASMRTARGLSQERLADLTGISVRALGDLERGATRRPQRQTLAALADGLGLDAAERERLVCAARPPLPTRPGRRGPSRAGSTDGAGSLVGREQDLAGLVKLLNRGTARLVTVLGPAGVGKSALARAALAHTDVHTTGVPTVTHALPESGRGLVLVDDSEDDLDGAAIAELLARNAGLQLIVTARSPIRVRAEHRWPVGPLSAQEAATLLARRAETVRGFAIAAEETATARSIVAKLGGNPMAIEVTAVRLRSQTVSEVDSALAVELAGAADQVLPRVVRSAIGRLPRTDAARLVLLAKLGRTKPHELRRALARMRESTDHLEATLALLSATALVTVTGPQVTFSVPPSVREAVLRQPVSLGNQR